MTGIASRPSGERTGWQDDPLTARARAVWGSVDFHPIARAFATGAEEFVRRLNLRANESLLDVACGTGNLAIPAGRAGVRVTGVDIAANLVEEARREARDLHNVEFDVGNAEQLPYSAGRFDTTVSMFGVMFAYRPERAAAELVRVTRKGGRIALASWTPESFVGHLLRAHVAVVPPPAGVPSPLRWGEEISVRAYLGDRVNSLVCTKRTLALRFPYGPAAVTETFATNYGPTAATLKNTDAAGQLKLRASLTRLFSEHNVAQDGTTVVIGEYLDVQARVA